jgi:hypothetical protein
MCLAYKPPDAPLVFALLGFAADNLLPDFAGNPLARFADTTRKPPHAPQGFNRSPTDLIRNSGTRPAADKATLIGFFAETIPSIQSPEPLWLWVHLTPP